MYKDFSRDYILNYVMPVVRNKAKFEKEFSTLMYDDFLDFAVAYAVRIGESVCSYITETELAEYDIFRGELRDAANRNLKKTDTVVTSLGEMLCLLGDGCGAGDGTKTVVCTTGNGVYGAAVILRDDVLDRAADAVGTDEIYILPSSIHEVLALPCDNCDVDTLANMVKEINKECVADEDVLTNSVYKYSKITGELTIAKKGR